MPPEALAKWFDSITKLQAPLSRPHFFTLHSRAPSLHYFKCGGAALHRKNQNL